MIAIRIVGAADGKPTPFDGEYLLEYDPRVPGIDPEGRMMDAHLLTVAEKEKARKFGGVEEAIRCYRQEAGVRWDGLPNRPLTGFTVEFENLNGAGGI